MWMKTVGGARNIWKQLSPEVALVGAIVKETDPFYIHSPLKNELVTGLFWVIRSIKM